jgi:hypothetical protein
MKKLLALFFVLVLFAGAAFAQDFEKTKFIVFGAGTSGTAPEDIKGFAIFGYPLTEKLVNYNRVDFSIAEGTSLNDLFHNTGLQSNIRTGLAYRAWRINSRLSLWGLGTGGFAFGGPEGLNGQTVVTGSFSGGGFVQYKINDRFATQLILEVAKNPVTGVEFAPAGAVQINLK